MQDAAHQDQAGPGEPANAEPRGRLARLLGDRPLSVYGVLAAGIGVLVVLLLIVYLTGRGDPSDIDRPPCFGIEQAEAVQAINNGLIERISIVSEQGKPERGPLEITLYQSDGNCREMPEGVGAQPELFYVIGVAEFYNQTRAGEQRILLRYFTPANIPPVLLTPPTATPTLTPIPTPTSPPTATLPPPTETPTPLPPTATPVPTETPAPATATSAVAIPNPSALATDPASPGP